MFAQLAGKIQPHEYTGRRLLLDPRIEKIVVGGYHANPVWHRGDAVQQHIPSDGKPDRPPGTLKSPEFCEKSINFVFRVVVQHADPQ